MSRNTVARLVSLDEPSRYRRKPRGSKLDPYKGSIGVMLEMDPRAPARVILERLRREGYDGEITILKQYVAGVRPPRRARNVTRQLSTICGALRFPNVTSPRRLPRIGIGGLRVTGLEAHSGL